MPSATPGYVVNAAGFKRGYEDVDAAENVSVKSGDSGELLVSSAAGPAVTGTATPLATVVPPGGGPPSSSTASGSASTGFPAGTVMPTIDALHGIMAKWSENIAGHMNAHFLDLQATNLNNTRDINDKFQALSISLDTVTDRIEGLETSTNRRLGDLEAAEARYQAQMLAAENSQQAKFDDLAAKVLAAPAAQAPGPGPHGPRAGPVPGPGAGSAGRTDEACLVLVRSFPEPLARMVLEETVAELRLFVPSAERQQMKVRIGAVDTQIQLTFTTPTQADAFVERFWSEKFYYLDRDTQAQTPLTVTKGKPLAVRRRGGAGHPVYAALEKALLRKEAYRSAKIVQRQRFVAGKSTNGFFVQIGRKVHHLFSLTFLEEQHSTTVEKVDFYINPVLTDEDCDAIRASTVPQ
jgi:hypothetical protein